LLKLIAQQNIDAVFVEVHQKLLRGDNRRIKTLGRSGEAIFTREDTPEQAIFCRKAMHRQKDNGPRNVREDLF